MKQFYPARWFFRAEWAEWWCRPEGMYEPGVVSEDTEYIKLRPEDAAALVQAMNEAGHIKPTIDERVHEADQKIIHRLIDLMEKGRKS